MKFNVVRAWKDEAYRQSLTKGQRDELPVNPAGELTEAEMELVTGGDGSGGGGGGGGIQPAVPAIIHHATYHHGSTTTATAASSASTRTVTSFSVICTIDVFSVSIRALSLVDSLISIANCEKVICAHIGG